MAKRVQKQIQPYVSSNIYQLSGNYIEVNFLTFSFIIVVDLFAAKIAGYNFISLTYETVTSTYL